MPNKIELPELITILNESCFADRTKILSWFKKHKKKDDFDQKNLSELQNKIEKAKQNFENAVQKKIKIDYSNDLPVSQKIGEIISAIEKNQVVIIAGETGSGKTTQIPKVCLQLKRGIKGLIGHTQPRRIAARSVANRLANELETEIGDLVGYKIRFNDRMNENTRIKLMTDGILLAEIQKDRYLNQYDTIIIDEAHERSLNIDFILGYLKNLLPKRPDLKIIITSATIDVERFSNHFNRAPIIEVSGRTYPVEVRYRPIIEQENADQTQAILNAIDELSHEKLGDILIFLSGEKEIRETADAISKQNYRFTEVLPLFARLSNQEQNRIFQSHSGRRIILSTNIAETSLTVPGIKYVIDSGLARISRYSFRSKVQRLPIEPISKASANQRKGRCGRTSDGICIRLYDESDFLSRPDFTDPEIFRTNLASVILKMTDLNLGNILDFPFVDSPDFRQINDGVLLLNELAAIKSHKNHIQLTEIGKNLAKFPLDPRLGKMIYSAKKLFCLSEILIIVSALSIQDPREKPLEKRQIADEKHNEFKDPQSDFLAILNLWNFIKENQQNLTNNQFRKLCQKYFLNYLRIQEWQEIYEQLLQIVHELKFGLNEKPANYQQIHSALLSGLLSQIGLKEIEKQDYLGARNIRFYLFPNSFLFKKQPKWCIVAELVETTKLWGRIAAQISPEWIEHFALHLIKKTHKNPFWSKKRGAVLASENITLFGLPIVLDRKVNFEKIDPKVSNEIFIRNAFVFGEVNKKYSFLEFNQNFLQEIEILENKARKRDFLINEDQLFAFYQQKIPKNICSIVDFEKWWKIKQKNDPNYLNFDPNYLLQEKEKAINESNFPDFWRQNEFLFKLSYEFDLGKENDGVSVHIPLNLLGQIDSAQFDWQIPGFRKDSIVALIKSLPKSIRRSLVPAPNYAEAFLSRIPAFSAPFFDSLENEFRKMTGMVIQREDWQLDQIPAHLTFLFLIENENGEIIAQGKNLRALQAKLQNEIQQEIAELIDSNIEKQNITNWDFGDLPKIYEQKNKNYVVKAFPTLIDNKNSVQIKLVENEAEQTFFMKKGLRKLIYLNVSSPIKYLQEKLPNKTKLSLYYSNFGSISQLIEDSIFAAIDELIIEFGDFEWNEENFLKLKQFVAQNLNENVLQITQKLEKVLQISAEIQKKLKGKIDLNSAFSLSDIKSHFNSLIFNGFISEFGANRLFDLDRYLQALQKRLEKLPISPQKDRENLIKIEKITQIYDEFLLNLLPNEKLNENVKEIRWMIEEFRVSLFAQQLKTREPISEKRIFQAIEKLKKC